MAILTILGVVVVTAVLAGIVILLTRTRAGAHGPRCGNCRYDLTGSESNRCPECGQLFIDAGVVPVGASDGVRLRYLVSLVAASAVVLLLMAALAVAHFARRAALEAQRAAQVQAQAAAVARFQAQMLAGASQPAPGAAVRQAFTATTQPAVATSQLATESP